MSNCNCENVIIKMSEEGVDGQSVAPKGAWDNTEEYHYLDLVSYNGSSYIATKTVPAGTLPTDTGYWMLSAEKGTQGDPGAPGQDGHDGAPGQDGAPATIAIGTVTTLPAGSDATVENVGTPQDAIINFGIPKGDQGDPGSGGSASWGSISGNLPDQSDLAQALQSKADVIVASASGSVASFPDGMASPVVGLTVGVELVQDLHGQSSPWPAGGGKNLFNPDSTEHWYYDGAGTRKTNDNARSIIIPAVEGDKAVISATRSSGGTLYICAADSNGDMITGSRSGSTGSESVNITAPTGTAFIYAGISDTEAFTNIQLETGTKTATAYAPYANICPISGHSSATVTRTGKNLWEYTVDDLTSFTRFSAQGDEYTSIGWIVTVPAGTYTISAEWNTTASTTYCYGGVFDANNKIVTQKNMVAGTTITAQTLTVAEGQKIIYYNGASGDDLANTKTKFGKLNIQLELGSTASPYEAYQGTSVTIPFGQTVYGGTLDVVGRRLTVDRKYAQIVASGVGVSVDTFTYALNDMKVGTSQAGLCDTFPTVNSSSKFGIRFGANSNTCYLYKLKDNISAITDLTTCRQWFTDNPVYIVYPLATPTVIENITDAQISTLLGQNCIWADTGAVSVSYRADTKLFIERLTQPSEDDMTANANIASGKFFMVGNNLYYSTASIATGEQIVPGTNCMALSLADALNNLNA